MAADPPSPGAAEPPATGGEPAPAEQIVDFGDAKPQSERKSFWGYLPIHYMPFAYFKGFQLIVLAILCAFIVVMATLDWMFKADNLKYALPLVLPLFTFVLGMSHAEERSAKAGDLAPK